MHVHIPPLLVVLAIAVAAPLIAEATRRIGVSNGLVKTSEAAPIVEGAMLTVILFPIIAMRLTGLSVAQATAHLGERDGL